MPPDSDTRPSSAPEPNPEIPPDQPSGGRRKFPWFWLGIFIGTLFGAAGLGLAAWAWIFINEDLSPLLSKTLTNSLERPVDLGDVEKVTLGSIQVGPSTIGAAADDSTTLEVDTTIVRFDLIETLLTSELGLDLTLIKAEGYLAQDEEKGWLDVDVPEQDGEEQDRRFEIRLDDIRVRDSQLTLVPLPFNPDEPQEIPFNDVNGSVSFDQVVVAGEDARRTRFEVTGDPIAGGVLNLKGEVQPVAVVDPVEESPADSETDGEEFDSNLKSATNLYLQSDKVTLDDILAFTLPTIGLFTDQFAVEAGVVSGTMDMAFRPDEPFAYSGALSVDEAAVSTDILPLPLENIEGQTRFQGNKWTIDRVSADYGDIDAVAEGLVDFDNGYDLTAVANDVTLKEFTETVDLELPVPSEGTFDAIADIDGKLDDPIFSGRAIATQPLQVDKLTFTSAAVDFRLQGQQLALTDITATPNTGGALRGSGQVRLAQGTPFTFDVTGRSLPAEAIAKIYGINPGFKLGLVSANASVVSRGGQVSTTIDWRAPDALYAGAGSIDINGRNIAFRDSTFKLGGGIVNASGNLLDGQWTSDISLAGVNLNAISENLTGQVSGDFTASGNTANTKIGAIAAQGNIAFTNGLATFGPQFASISDPLTAQVAWNGEKLQISQARTDRITASGTLTPIFDSGFEGLERIDLNVVAQDYGINEIPFVTIPTVLNLAGRTDFNGTISGSPEAPNVTGDVRLTNLVANRLPFNDLLTGTVDFAFASGLDLNLTGPTDNIALNIGPSTFAEATPTASPDFNFDIDWRNTFARGQTQGDILAVQAGNFPLSVLNFPAAGAADIGQLRGTLTAADLAVNLNDQTLIGDIAINQLGLGYIGAGRLAGQVRYANDLATFTSGELTLGDNLYALSGSLALDGPVPVYNANLQTQQGNVQNILTALSIYELSDFRRGLTAPTWLEDPPSQSVLDGILATSSTGNPDAALIEQLRRLAEIQALQAEARVVDEARPVPPLAELTGPFAGNIQLNGAGSDFKLDFDLAGANWQWGDDYSAEEVIAKGSLTPNVLTLEPVRFASVIPIPEDADASLAELGLVEPEPVAGLPNLSSDPDAPVEIEVQPVDGTEGIEGEVESAIAAINLAGQIVFGRNTELTSNLQATAQNLDVSAARDILEIPLDIDGYANANASLGGTLANPQLRGQAEIAAATINDTPIETATAQFLYQNARLSLASTLTASTPEQPLTLTGQIPYAFNFMDVQPESEDITVSIDVRDEGLALLNIFTQQVAWESGSGAVNLNVGGTLRDPQIDGVATLDDAVISAQVLPEPLTNVTGRAIFQGERIIVEGLEGQFSDGQLTAAGIFPLLYPVISGSRLSALTAATSTAGSDIPETNPETDPEASLEGEAGLSEDGETTITNPLFPQPLAADRPLTVNFEDVALNLDNLYSGGVNGQIVVGGSALLGGPQIGGQVILSNGRVLLPEGNGAAATTASSDSAFSPTLIGGGSDSGGITTNFRDLRLTLGPAIQITQGNLLNFVADGTLLLNGPPTDLEPDGTINIKSGRVSLFNTVFRLRGRDNTAVFTREMGIANPFLDVSLRSNVPEVDRPPTVANTPFANAEIADTSNIGFSNPGSLRTIRVFADVNGPANAIFENLELSSSPSRSETELLALIGGGFVDAIESTVGSLAGSGDGFEGLINLVGGTVLTRVQDLIGNTLSLSEFRLFPVTSASRALSDEDNESESGLDIAATAGFDVTDSTSVSLTKILTDSSNPEVGVNYSLTDSLTVRSATNFDDINQFLIEYELRF